jgi:hypothetical protein
MAGAVGTVALNIATYADMAIRGRAPSRVPARVASALAQRAGLNLASDDQDSADKTAQHRRSALGALLGYLTGVGVGVAYGLVQPRLRDVPPLLAGIGVGMTAMAASDISAVVTGVTDPTTWSRLDWGLDLGFHAIYGLATAITYDTVAEM